MKLKKPKKKTLKARIPRIGCPFCWEWLPRPQMLSNVFSAGSTLGGRCDCGAFFTVDETGKSGGQTLLDLQALACDGDLDRALRIQEDIDFELKTKPYQFQSDPMGRVRGNPHLQPKIWALKLLDKKP
jgi:hypothetical protein